jgi:hypothetical protein
MSRYELAQLNIASMKGPIDSPLMAEFVANLDRVNHIAQASPGYVWRLQTDAGDATALRPFGEAFLVNLSVWKDIDALRAFVFGAGHVEIMRRRQEWFRRMTDAYAVLWWVPAGHVPSVEEAKQRLEYLKLRGPSAFAFTFQLAFPAPASAD